MKERIAAVFVALMMTAIASAQIPNPSFENWTDEQPDGWVTNNVPGSITAITRVQPAAAGTYALQGEVVPFLEISNYGPFVQAIFPFNDRPAELTGSYKFTSVGGDTFYILVSMYSQSGLVFVAAGAINPPPSDLAFQRFSLPLQYFSEARPDTCLIEFFIAGEDTVHAGSRFVVDDLAFAGSATGVEEDSGIPETFGLAQNYPNPFNPSTTIRYTLPAVGHVRLTVSNLLGETVATVVDAVEPAGTHGVRFDAAALPSGLYFYTLRSGALTETRRMMLLR
jgi:hypothetical protein